MSAVMSADMSAVMVIFPFLYLADVELGFSFIFRCFGNQGNFASSKERANGRALFSFIIKDVNQVLIYFHDSNDKPTCVFPKSKFRIILTCSLFA